MNEEEANIKLYNLIGKKEVDIMMDKNYYALAEICPPTFLTCDTKMYTYLSEIISKEYTVIDFGSGYNAQSYLFKNHNGYIAIEPELGSYNKVEQPIFQAKGTLLFKQTGMQFIKNTLPTLNLDLKKTFAIMNYNPSWEEEDLKGLICNTFSNMYIFYPS